MFKKFLARFGKGAATVDLRFENRPYHAGETVHGEVMMQGGEVEQKINHLAARLMMSVATKQGTVTREAATIPLTGAYTILPKEQKVIPFVYTLPKDLPLSRGVVSYYFDTHLDIEGGVDRTDVDRLVIEASEDVYAVFQAFARLGFREKPTSGKLDQYGQEFAFFPTEAFSGQVSEVEIRFASEHDGVRIWMEVDCRGGYKEIEAKRELFIGRDTLQDSGKLVRQLEESIKEAVQNPHMYANQFSYKSHHSHGGSMVPGMIGGLAVGIIGGMLLEEMMEDVFEDVGEALGFDDEGFDGGDFGGDDF